MDKLMDWLWPIFLGLLVGGLIVHDFNKYLDTEREKDKARETVELLRRRVDEIDRRVDALDRRIDAFESGRNYAKDGKRFFICPLRPSVLQKDLQERRKQEW